MNLIKIIQKSLAKHFRKPYKLRRIRSDARIRTVEKKIGAGNILTNKSGRNTRSDKKLGNYRKDRGK